MRSAATSIVSWPVTLLDTTVVASCVSPMGVARLWLKSYCCASSNAIALDYWDCLLKNLLFLFSSIRFFSPLSPLSVIAIYVVACFFLFYYIRTFCFILPPSVCLYLIFLSYLNFPPASIAIYFSSIGPPFSSYLSSTLELESLLVIGLSRD